MVGNATTNFALRKLIRIALFIAMLALIAASVHVVLAQSAGAGGQNARKAAATAQQPVYGDYKGVRIGITTDEARAMLGQPTLKGEDQDYYVISEKESAQIAYDASHRVFAISVDYVGGIGAPDPKVVVGGELQAQNGSAYKMVHYEGFWVSYNRSAGPMIVVTITIQKAR